MKIRSNFYCNIATEANFLFTEANYHQCMCKTYQIETH